METEATCGTGVAENAVLPAKLAALTAAMAAVLEAHQNALDRTDADSRLELAAYQQVAEALRATASQLRAASERMAASRDVPMGKHDEDALASPHAVEVFADFVRAERDLLAWLQERVEADEAMLAEMRAAGAA